MIEQNLIGCILNDNSVLADVANIVSVNDFKNNNARETYRFCLEMWRSNIPVDLVVVADKLKKVNPVYLAESTNVPSVTLAKTYASQIAEKAKQNRLRTSIAGTVGDEILDSDSIIERVSNIITSEANLNDDISNAKECVEQFTYVLKNGGIKGYETGFHTLDSLDISIVKGDYWVVGASTSVGKTAFALNIFCFLIENYDLKISFISTEMTKNQLMSRIIAYYTNIASKKIIKGRCNQYEQEKVDKCLKYLSDKIFFLTEKTFEISQIENKVRSLNMKHDIDIVFVDYIQHCQSAGHKDLYSKITDVSLRLQKLAKVADVCCFALSQLSNDFSKNNKSGIEFKGSGDIAGDCDVGIILGRKKGYENILTMDIRKNRHGQLGSSDLCFLDNYSRLDDYSV